MDFLRWFQPNKRPNPTAYSIIDVGRDSVKAVVVQMSPDSGTPQVVGYGLAETGGHDVTGGRLEANAVIRPVNAALTQAEDSTEQFIGHKVVPDDVIFVLAGRAAIGQLASVQQIRAKPALPVSAKELNALRHRAEEQVRRELAGSSFAGGQWQPLAVTDAGTRLDDRLVLDGVGLTGREINFSVFGMAGQAGALRALEVLASRLDLLITNIVASPHALASVTPHPEAIILDIGFSGTDICLIKHDALVATEWVPFGGHFFTHSLAAELDIDPVKANILKHALAAGNFPATEAERVDIHLETARYRWFDEVMDVLDQFAINEPLPRRIYMTGGGSLLPGLDRLLRANPEPFDSAPEIIRLGSQPLPTVKNLTDSLNYNLFAVALSATIGIP